MGFQPLRPLKSWLHNPEYEILAPYVWLLAAAGKNSGCIPDYRFFSAEFFHCFQVAIRRVDG